MINFTFSPTAYSINHFDVFAFYSVVWWGAPPVSSAIWTSYMYVAQRTIFLICIWKKEISEKLLGWICKTHIERHFPNLDNFVNQKYVWRKKFPGGQKNTFFFGQYIGSQSGHNY